MDTLRSYVRLSRPLNILSLFVLYALGGGIARYLGTDLDWNAYWLGQAWAVMLMLGGFYLNEYFRRESQPLSAQEKAAPEFLRGTRRVVLAALAALAVLASITVLVIAQVRPASLAYLVMAFAFLGAFFYSAPPLKLEVSGYGELLVSILVAYLTPAFAFVLQTGEWHRLLAMAGFPLVVLHLAMLLALQLPSYAEDTKYTRRTLMIRMGWQRGMVFHNILVLAGFLLLALAALLRFPWSIAWPALLPLPLGLYQIYQIRAIASGARPNWQALTVGALALFASTAYLLTFAFWMN